MTLPNSRLLIYKVAVSKLITEFWPAIIVAWIALAIGLKLVAPAWTDIAADGDLAFLPDDVANARGQVALETAFPGSVSRSRLVVVFARKTDPLGNGDVALALDFARRLHWLAAETSLAAMHADEPEPNSEPEPNTEPKAAPEKETLAQGSKSDLDLMPEVKLEDFGHDWSTASETAKDNLSEVLEIEAELAQYIESSKFKVEFKRIPFGYQRRGELLQRLGDEEQAAIDLDLAQLMLEEQTPTLDALSVSPDWSEQVLDVWSWRNPVVGHKLASPSGASRLLLIQLGTELTATRNIQILNEIESLVEQLRTTYGPLLSDDLQIEITGSAAVGADMLRASAGGVKQTEIATVVLVLLILAFVYRAPFLVAIPLLSITLSLIVSTSVIALLARDPADPASWGIGVFTTSRIFIVVLLFGAGTDFCLFFLARNRELLQEKPVNNRRQMLRVIASGWRSVHDALVASALTTIVGLGLMWFSEFEKFQFSGPTIAISLAVTLLVCLTFTPAVLCGLGRVAFWPLLSRSKPKKQTAAPESSAALAAGPGAITNTNLRPAENASRYWSALADFVVDRPGIALIVTLTILLVPAGWGFLSLNRVTYDLTDELSSNATSRRGEQLIARDFSSVDSTPITFLLIAKEPFESEEALRSACESMTERLYIDGVDSVRSLTDPLGDYPPGKRMGLFATEAWRRRILLNHRITRQRFVSSETELVKRLAKFDVVLANNPFSVEANATLQRLQNVLKQASDDTESPWNSAEIEATGTTVGISDLRRITQADQRRIQILVTLGVWLVLILILRRIALCTYLIFTVLVSYFATLGITYTVFATIYGAVSPDIASAAGQAGLTGYAGLDWKVPLFLFVILVAVGQDYNVYLVTRIFEEQQRHSLTEGVRRALRLTGGIITSCGLVMAGTFIAMTSPAVSQWLSTILPDGWIANDIPVLRGITELGFALSLGVLLDTLVVRSILVPAFIVLWQRKSSLRSTNA